MFPINHHVVLFRIRICGCMCKKEINAIWNINLFISMSYFSFMFPMSCQHIFLYFVWSWLIKILYILEFRILLSKQFIKNIETHYILYYPFYNHMIYVLCSLMCNYYGLNHVMIISKQSTFNICWDYFLNMKCTLQLGLYLTKSLHLYNICCWNMRRRHLFIKLFC